MSNNRPHHRFLSHAVQNFLWGRARRREQQRQQQQQHQQPQQSPQQRGEQERVVDSVQDREMTPVEDIQEQGQIRAPSPSQYDDMDVGNRSDDSMPDLQSASDSDSDQDAHDVEMHVVEDDLNHDWTDDEDGLPALESTDRNDRRTRVEEEDEQPRRTDTNFRPPQSINIVPSPLRQNAPPWNFGSGLFRGQSQPDIHHIFPAFAHGGATAQPNSRPETNTAPGPGRPHVHAHAYVVALDGTGRPITIQMGLPPAEPMPQPQGIPMFDFIVGGGAGGTPFGGGDMPTWADVMQMFGREPQEREDPERAKKLVAGLEDVPIGLVKRMIRVGGAPGGHVDDAQSLGSETPGCAVCWDSLLNENDDSDGGDIVSLPCSHVFHASCLIPWFSKPRHTTCPTCRFNIDPENLTQTPRRAQSQRHPNAADRSTPTQTHQEEPHGEQSTRDQIPRDQPTEGHSAQSQPHSDGQAGVNQFPTQPESTQSQFNGTGWLPRPSSMPGGPSRTIHHGHTHIPGFTVDFTWQIPNTGDQDDERLTEDLQNQASAFVQQFLGGMGGPLFGGIPRMNPGSQPLFGEPSTQASQSPPRKEWSPPPAPGPTLRQRVERKEREAGLRCDDASCGIGPSDEEPHPFPLDDAATSKQISISQESDRNVFVCSHKFHPSCLVSADRCSRWGEDAGKEKSSFEVVTCPMCRASGRVPRDVWDEGAEALLV